MTTLTSAKRAAEGKRNSARTDRNARLSAYERSKRPYPETRQEADELFAPNAPMARVTTMRRLARLLKLDMLAIVAPGTGHITNQEAHLAILDALYGPDGQLKVDPEP